MRVTPEQFSAVELDRLRSARLERLQGTMRVQGVPACLFFHPANVRYATGTDSMAVYSALSFIRCTLVTADRPPILFETHGVEHVSRRSVADVRPMIDWQHKGYAAQGIADAWAAAIIDAMRELGLRGEPLAVDRLDVPGFAALQRAGVAIVDSGPCTLEAREVKTPEELAVVRCNGAIADTILADVEKALEPGIREYELVAVLGHSLLRQQGECLFTRLVASGPNVNPWMTEAGDRVVCSGDLVGIDTDANGWQGYVVDVSRTFLCGLEPARAGQKDCYGVAYDCVMGMAELVRPGMTFQEFAEAAPRLPARFKEQRYVTMVHQAGLEDELVDIPYPEDVADGRADYPDRVIREGMVLCLECYAGEVGSPYGAKLEEQVIVTPEGCDSICTYPFEDRLL
jgi:Xaa-Pro aminopeptidase